MYICIWPEITIGIAILVKIFQFVVTSNVNNKKGGKIETNRKFYTKV